MDTFAFAEGLVWFVPYKDTRPWKKTLQEQKAHLVAKQPWIPTSKSGAVQTAAQRREVKEICDAFSDTTGRGSYVPTLQV